MSVPKFSKNRDISSKLEEIDRVKFRIEQIGIVPKYEKWLEREMFIRTAYSSTMVEDAAITENEMELMAKQAPIANILGEKDRRNKFR